LGKEEAVNFAVGVAAVAAVMSAAGAAAGWAVMGEAGGDEPGEGRMMPSESRLQGISKSGWFEEMKMTLLGGHMRCLLYAWLAATLATVLTLAVVWSPSAFAAEVKQKRFASAEEGVQALMAALKANDVKAMLAILGPDARPLIITGDAVADRQERERVVREYEEAHSLAMSGETKAVLQVGKDDWPMPIPLVKDDAGWRFDTHAGKEEILNRRIGRNELAAIEVCRAYVDAQREYYLLNPGRDALHQYAQKFLSTKGKRDGLYWTTKDSEEPSPLGPLIARAQGRGYVKVKDVQGRPLPYYGYYYRILKSQGADAPGGAYDYVVRGKMIGGFALVAYPANWGNSGVMTFIVNHDGVVYQKDIGPDTAAAARAMTRFDPDSTWTRL
jgi:hypothetical protein